jgi:hypothetical protein
MAETGATAQRHDDLGEHGVSELVRRFDAAGFVVLPSLLGAQEVAEITGAITD